MNKNYQLTFEDYQSVINYYHKGVRTIKSTSNGSGDSYIFNFYNVGVSGNDCRVLFNNNNSINYEWSSLDGDVIIIDDGDFEKPCHKKKLKNPGPREISLRLQALYSMNQFDFEGLNLWCNEFMRDFKGVDLNLELWGSDNFTRKLFIFKTTNSHGIITDWTFNLKENISLLGRDEKLFVAYNQSFFHNGVWGDGNHDESKICEYSKYKELEAFI